MKQSKHTIQLLQAAEDDFKEIITYIALDNPSAAEAIAEKIEKTLSNLSTYPFIGKTPNEEELANMGYRFLVV
jgi:plasmid stabilization system protein ParE